MSNYTYEFQEKETKLETYEWDNVWWEQTNIEDIPRVLYIGDSISCGVRKLATEMADGSFLFDGFGTSKALDNPYFFDSIQLFARQQGKRAAVLFNNGLHGWHLDDQSEYHSLYESMIQRLVKTFDKTPLFLLLTTPVANKDRDQRVLMRNRLVCELAEKHELPTIDLYATMKEHMDLQKPDGVHWQESGYRILANHLLDFIKKSVPTQKG